MSEPRRSTRLQAINRDLAVVESARPSKRRRTARHATDDVHDSSANRKTRKPKRGLGGLTGALQYLPLDVLYEVFAYLAPLDLLAVSRSTRDLRLVLLNRSARAVWVNALHSWLICAQWGEVSLLACPPYLPEPAYASLMLESICSLCGEQTNRSTLLMAIRKRCCVDCFGMKQNFVPCKSLLSSLGTKYAAIVEELLAPITPTPRSELGAVHKGTFYQADEVKIVTSFVKAHYGNKDAMSKFVNERKVALATHQERADSAARYEARASNAAYAISSMRSSVLRDARDTRRDTILARISEAGYDDVAVLLRPKGYWLTRGNIPWSRTRYHFFESTTFVATSRPLTDRVWAAHKEDVLDDMLTVRHHSIIQRRLQYLYDLCREHPACGSLVYGTSVPSEVLDESPALQMLIHAPTPDRFDAPDPALKDADEVLGDALDDFFSFGRSAMRAELRLETLARLLPPLEATTAVHTTQITEVGASLARLEADALCGVRSGNRERLALAATWFRCSRCECALSAPEAELHHCSLWRIRRDDPRWFLWEGRLESLPWNDGGVLAFDEGASDFAAGLVALSRRDPSVATLEEVENSDVRFRCVHPKCKTQTAWRVTWPILGAVQHALKQPHHAAKLVLKSGSVEAA